MLSYLHCQVSYSITSCVLQSQISWNLKFYIPVFQFVGVWFFKLTCSLLNVRYFTFVNVQVLRMNYSKDVEDEHGYITKKTPYEFVAYEIVD